MSNIDRANEFYMDQGGVQLLVDSQGGPDFRVVQTRPARLGGGRRDRHRHRGDKPARSIAPSACCVGDIEAARDGFVSRGTNISKIFHSADRRTGSIDPRAAQLCDLHAVQGPDGDTWLVQEVERDWKVTDRRDRARSPPADGPPSNRNSSPAAGEQSHGALDNPHYSRRYRASLNSPGKISAITLFVEDLAERSSSTRTSSGCHHFEDDNSAVFDFGNTLIDLLRHRGAGAHRAGDGRDAPRPASRCPVHDRVDDVDAMCAEVTARGARVAERPDGPAWGIRTATFRDPGGHIWEIAK